MRTGHVCVCVLRGGGGGGGVSEWMPLDVHQDLVQNYMPADTTQRPSSKDHENVGNQRRNAAHQPELREVWTLHVPVPDGCTEDVLRIPQSAAFAMALSIWVC